MNKRNVIYTKPLSKSINIKCFFSLCFSSKKYSVAMAMQDFFSSIKEKIITHFILFLIYCVREGLAVHFIKHNFESGLVLVMILRVKVFLILISFFFAFNATAQNRSCDVINTAFKGGEEVNYIVAYNWGLISIDAGAVIFKTISEQYKNNEVYHLVGAAKTFSYWDWFFDIRDIYESWVNPNSLLPIKFKRDIKDKTYFIKEKYDFDRQNMLVYSASERTRKSFISDTIKINPCTFDVLSVIYNARNIDYAKYIIGDTIPVSVIMDNEVFNIYFRYKGKEEKNVKDMGKYRCIKFGVFLVDSEFFNEGEDMNIWVTDDENRIPLIIESPILVGNISARVVGIKGAMHEMNSLIEKSGFFW